MLYIDINIKKWYLLFLISSNMSIFAKEKIPHISDKTDMLKQLKAHKLWKPGKPLKLHLGCGQNNFDGYINFDLPPKLQTVQERLGVDAYADITNIWCSWGHVDEIRLHFLLEKFTRYDSLADICKWSLWLKKDGILIIESADFLGCVSIFLRDNYTYKEKQTTMRHLFGSNEAEWAYHKDAWYQQKYIRILTALGFEVISIRFSEYKACPNILVTAKKIKNYRFGKLIGKAKFILKDYMVDNSSSEKKQHEVWSKEFEKSMKNQKKGEKNKNDEFDD